jgi:hypothetical protein
MLGLIFYCQAPTLATLLREGGLNESDLDEIIDTLDLQTQLNAARLANNSAGSDRMGNSKKKEIVDVKFFVVAIALHALFYKTYPGLKERCEREHDFAMGMFNDPVTKKRRPRGYARSWGGPIRHLPELRYMRWSSKKKLVGGDSKLWSSMFSGLKNQAGNTAIQTMEVYHTAPIVHCASHNFKKNGLRSRVYNYVHDSQDLYVLKPEKDLVLAIYEEMLKAYDKSGFGIPIEMDADVADITGDMRGTGKGQYFYHHGDEVHLKGRSIAVEAERLGIPFEFENTIPE